MVDRCWVVGVGESWSEWFAGCQREWGAWWNRRRCSVNSHHMGGTVCIFRDPLIFYRKSLSFLWKNLLPLFIYICFVNEGLRGKKIPLKLQIYTNTYISMIQVFFILQSMKKGHSECFNSWNIWFQTIIGWFESAWTSLKTLYSIRKPKCKMEITKKLTLYMYRHFVMFVTEWE